MNKNFKKKNKINNLLNRKLSFLINKIRYRRRSKLNAVPYIVKNNPQKYGPGRNLSVINAIYSLNSSDGYRFSLQTLLFGNTEFTTKKLYFRYFKVLEIRAVFLQSGKNSDGIHYLNFSWNSIEESYEDIVKDDSTKIVPYYRPRTRIVKWRPIRSVINVNSILQEIPTNFINMSEFLSTDRIVSIPGWLYVTNTSESDQVMLEVVLEFRGNDFGTSPKLSKINQMKEIIEKLEKEIKEKGEENSKKWISDSEALDKNLINKKEDIFINNEEEFKEINEEQEESIQYSNNKQIPNSNNMNIIESNKEKIGKIREGNLTYSRVKDIDNSQPQLNKKLIHYNLIKEDDRFQDIEDPIFPLKFYDNNNQERLTGKEGIINKLDNLKTNFIETEINEKSEDKNRIKKENVSKSKTKLLRETSSKNILSNKISEIT